MISIYIYIVYRAVWLTRVIYILLPPYASLVILFNRLARRKKICSTPPTCVWSYENFPLLFGVATKVFPSISVMASALSLIIYFPFHRCSYSHFSCWIFKTKEEEKVLQGQSVVFIFLNQFSELSDSVGSSSSNMQFAPYSQQDKSGIITQKLHTLYPWL